MTPEQEQLVLDNVPLARSIAGRMARPRRSEADEIHSDAMLGLCDAATRWAPDRGVPFGAYATRRINGEILDGLRSRGLLTKGEIAQGVQRHVVELVGEIAYDNPLSQAAVGYDPWPDVDDELAEPRLIDLVMDNAHTERERQVLAGMLAGRTMKAIGRDIGVTEGRVSQVLASMRQRARVNGLTRATAA